MKRVLLSLSLTAIFGISSTINSLDLFDHTMNKQDNISGINDENFLDNENEKNLQEINLESSSKI
ncbi:hypothetical protein N8960_00910 [bacterium]|nr:hypothetical protein [bacterium]|tara:strand:+ start:585 stop:779 length:195 start_codon:yes stop_codon:yes gene_type:complete